VFFTASRCTNRHAGCSVAAIRKLPLPNTVQITAVWRYMIQSIMYRTHADYDSEECRPEPPPFVERKPYKVWSASFV
jgi:hypothetical protein